MLLVKKYVTLTLTHIEEWKDDPESFLTGEEMDLYTEKKRVRRLHQACTKSILVYGRELDPLVA